MQTREQLKQQLEKRTAALAKQAGKDSKATPDHVRRTRKLLKRACRRLAKLDLAVKRKAKAAEGEGAKPAAAAAAAAAAPAASAAASAAPAKAEEKK